MSIQPVRRPGRTALHLLFCLMAASSAGAAERDVSADCAAAGVVPAFTVAPEIREVSAAVFDSAEGLLWTLGDGGDGIREKIGRTSLADRSTTSLLVTGACNHDWEALAMDDGGRLWILDVGDNGAVREQVLLHRVDPGDAAGQSVPVTRTITVTYPDGPMDVEAGACFQDTVYLFEKRLFPRTGAGPLRVLAVDVSEASGNYQEALPAGTLPVCRTVTDASVSPEGYLYLLTYTGIIACGDWHSPVRSAWPVLFFFLGQQESLAALGRNSFYVGVEDGSFYCVRKRLSPLR